jgi:hypothetical protein
MTWTESVERFLLDATACPRCQTRTWGGAPAMREGICARCGTDLTGEAGSEVWAASEAAVAALTHRQALVDALPTVHAAERGAQVPHASAAPPVEPASPAAYQVAPAATPAAPPRPRSAVSLQSVLAVVGAGLLAVAAIVFTFLNPDLTDFATRTTIIAVVTAVFLGGAWLLHNRRLQFSAEAVGALGMVFVALDIWAFSQVAPEGVSAWYFGAIGLAVAAATMVAVGAWMRMRTWLWSGLIGLAIVPAFLGYAAGEQAAADSGWAATWGHVGVLFAAWALLELLRPVSARLGSSLLADRYSLTTLQSIALVSAVVMALIYAPGTDDSRLLAIASVLAVLAVGAFLSTRVAIAAVWSAVGGLLVAFSGISAAFAIPITDDSWIFALVAGSIALLLALLAVVRRTGSVQRGPLVASVVIVGALAAIPGALIVGFSALIVPAMSWRSTGVGSVPVETALLAASAVISLLALAAGLAVLGRFGRLPSASTALLIGAEWVAAIAVIGIPLAFPGSVQLAIAYALALSAAASAALLFLPRLRSAPASRRAPLVVLAHLMPVLALLLSWPDAAVAAVAGALIVAAWALAARTVPAVVRPIHTAAGFGYALIAASAALSLTELDVLPILCLVTTAGAVVAIAASVTSWLPVGSWYSMLGVTAVPFGIGVVSVLLERSGWTALSTGVIFLLAATLVLTRRTGTTTFLRAGAAALLVPTLAVVVVCLTAEFLDQSGSRIALPIIAVLVACALPTTGLVHDALLRRGFSPQTSAAVRFAIEVSSLVTGGIAVILSLARDAAGYEIAFLVLVILGLGAAATALWLKRRYGWWTAAAAWTGALWCAWAMIGVEVVEPYLLPPAVAAMIVGAILVARRRTGPSVRPAAALFATGLGIAIVPSLAILAITGNGSGTTLESEPTLWRSLALLAAGVLLTGLADRVTRPIGSAPTRFEGIRIPLLVGAVVSASAGAVQGVRWGWALDALPLPEVHAMAQVLAFAALAAALAWAVARLARVAGATSRWLYAPVLVYLAVGPMAAIDDDPVSIWTLWGLELVLLVAMIATVWRSRERAAVFPPVWFQWSLAWVVAVVAWSQREVLRVEGFALPLGFALVIAGTIALLRGRRDGDDRRFANWPIGYEGSWALLAPGIVATLLPSIAATFTDPVTWRAILVIALALVAVLIGARKTLAAPFILGISALPLEILVVFLVQVGGTISPLLWWITLATAGIVLLVIAVGWERRTGADATLAARIRDLR